MNYKRISQLDVECNCTCISIGQWDRLMKGAVRANKREINRLVKEYLPDLYNELALDFYNPYNYARTKTHLILKHSGIEYFIRFH